jgi:hypothetical protein
MLMMPTRDQTRLRRWRPVEHGPQGPDRVGPGPLAIARCIPGRPLLPCGLKPVACRGQFGHPRALRPDHDLRISDLGGALEPGCEEGALETDPVARRRARASDRDRVVRHRQDAPALRREPCLQHLGHVLAREHLPRLRRIPDQGDRVVPQIALWREAGARAFCRKLHLPVRHDHLESPCRVQRVGPAEVMVDQIAKRPPEGVEFPARDGRVRVVAIGPFGGIHGAGMRDIDLQPTRVGMGGDIGKRPGLGRNAGPQRLEEQPEGLVDLATQASVPGVE